MAEAGFRSEKNHPVLRPSVVTIFMRRRRQMLYALAYIGQAIFFCASEFLWVGGMVAWCKPHDADPIPEPGAIKLPVHEKSA